MDKKTKKQILGCSVLFFCLGIIMGFIIGDLTNLSDIDYSEPEKTIEEDTETLSFKVADSYGIYFKSFKATAFSGKRFMGSDITFNRTMTLKNYETEFENFFFIESMSNKYPEDGNYPEFYNFVAYEKDLKDGSFDANALLEKGEPRIFIDNKWNGTLIGIILPTDSSFFGNEGEKDILMVVDGNRNVGDYDVKVGGNWLWSADVPLNNIGKHGNGYHTAWGFETGVTKFQPFKYYEFFIEVDPHKYNTEGSVDCSFVVEFYDSEIVLNEYRELVEVYENPVTKVDVGAENISFKVERDCDLNREYLLQPSKGGMGHGEAIWNG